MDSVIFTMFPLAATQAPGHGNFADPNLPRQHLLFRNPTGGAGVSRVHHRARVNARVWMLCSNHGRGRFTLLMILYIVDGGVFSCSLSFNIYLIISYLL